MKLDHNVAAVVTGGSSGLGAATAVRLASHGVKVALFDLDAEAGESLARQIGGVFCRADVGSDKSVEEAFSRAREAHGQERVLINCAGIVSAHKTAARDKLTGVIRPHQMADYEQVIRINLFGTFRCIAQSTAGMLTLALQPNGERGAVVNTASIAADEGQMGQAAYSASKAGVAGMTLPIARDLASEGIRVNTIKPGFFDTPMLRSGPEHVRRALEDSVPFPSRVGDPDEYAQLVEFLLTNGYMNGECVRIDGAARMTPR
ncbi:3-oxoacyl-[acyl-carrier-protein] reductase FabG [Variovorax boronicumulans]|uniref:SDR family NAD(P)-dependent oxidoreductase n=1 Tax=Variovorax boronicumulans TaxID=436515 RepID=UPI000BB3C3E8|nr:SDR family NAD(P)-dependent oxidoreductase [Variovorax boronicumulans]PBI87788.1 3-oxoacyl-[acyl-carrier-protein] reductase FabG [Variovorax boronicumulans]